MKRQVRNNVFETNSSSMHSLVVMKNDEKYTEDEIRDDIYIDEDGEWMIWNDLYYGRSPFKILSSFSDKFKYTVASMVKRYGDDTYKELFEIVRKYIPELKRIKFTNRIVTILNKEKVEKDSWKYEHAMTEDEFLEYVENLEKIYEVKPGSIDYWLSDDEEEFELNVYDMGGVDDYILAPFLEKENITLEEFLANKKYIIVVDGDEYCIYKDMKDIGLINTNAIDHEYPDYSWMV